MTRSILPLKLSDVSVKRRGKRLIGPVDFQLSERGLTIIVGPNGSGKTTLLRVMHGVERVSSGAVEWAVDEVEARHHQSYVFQAPIMLRRSVADNLRYPLELFKVPKRDREVRMREWAARIGLTGALKTPATRLSGGEKQKLALARSLIRRPEVLFLDEPCANLDGPSTREIETLLHEALSAGTKVIMTTHDMGQAKRLASDAIFMLRGRIREAGEATEFFTAPKTPELRAFFRGDIIE